MKEQTDRRGFLRNAAGAGLAVTLPTFSGVGPMIESTLSNQENTTPRTLREQFPALAQKVNGHDLAFLDNAATAQRPLAVIQAMTDYYRNDNANPSATMHTLARRSAAMYTDARQTVAHFINAASPNEIVWTHGTTEAINLVASSWAERTSAPAMK
jgi:selenocysteine lyase/cysteine desulfurase